MSKKQGIIITLIALASLCLSIASLSIALRPLAREERDIQYVLKSPRRRKGCEVLKLV